jgi:HPt (histidine-containing phosphotransfer) domain-containing protein
MLDKAKALDDFQITEEVYDEMLTEFVAQAAEKAEAIESAAKKGNVKEAADIAHALKGVGGNLRLDDCYTIARNIELAIKGNAIGTVASEIANLKKALEEIRTAIKR